MSRSLISDETWSLSPLEHGRLVIHLNGDFDETSARALSAALRERLAGVAAGSFVLLVDLNRLTRCSVDARGHLLQLQRFVGGVARRTAYITERPLFRGVGLWICHHAPDSNARTFPSETHANVWLGGTLRREDALANRAVLWFDHLRRSREAIG